MAALASTPVTRGPVETVTVWPLSRSAAIRRRGILASSRVAIPAQSVTSARSRSGDVTAGLRPRIPRRAARTSTGKTSRRLRLPQTSARPARDPGDVPCAPTHAAFIAPADVPTSRSGSMPWAERACSIPTWTAPRLPPPESTKAVLT